MKTGLRTPPNNATRGSVMLCVLLFTIAAASIALYAVSDTMNARQANLREESYANGLSAAEYGAEIAISEIAKGLVLANDSTGRVSDLSPVVGDWVLGQNNGTTTLFRDGGVTDLEQRRIRGVFNDHEFRVRVRSSRQAYQRGLVSSANGNNGPLPAGWLWNPGDFNFGRDKAYAFKDVYEITSTARPRSLTEDGTVSAAIYSEPVIQTVVEYKYNSPLGSLMQGATLILEKPENFIATAAETQAIDHDAPIVFKTTAQLQSENAYAAPNDPIAISGPLQQLKNVYNINISGEDHDIRKQSIPQIVTERITTPLRLTTNEARFFNATGGYWTSGILTLNFIDINDNDDTDLLQKYKEVEVTSKKEDGKTSYKRKVRMPVANPHRPFNSTDVTKFYSTSQLNDIINKKSLLDPNLAMWTQYADGRTVDTYLLGGKSRNSQGMTVSYDPMSGYNINSSFWVNGKQVINPPATGYLKALTNSSDKFNIVLGAFEDLPRLYINMAHSINDHTGGWAQMYVGQFTRDKRRTTMNDKSAPLLVGTETDDGGGAKAKIRPQTLHMVLNEKDQMLVREYEYTFPNGQVVYYAYEAAIDFAYYQHKNTKEVAFNNNNPGANKTEQALWVKSTVSNAKPEWKGNYMWCDVTFPNTGQFNMVGTETVIVKGYNNQDKFNLSQTTIKNGTACVPRQFFWQELVGYSLEKDYSTKRYGEPALIEDGLGYLDSKNKTDASSRRTYARLDDKGNTIPVGFDEAYQRSPLYRNNSARWNPYNPNTVLAKLDYPSYLVDAHDPIPVRNPDTGLIENKYSMDDLLFTKEFIIDEDTQETIEREAICLFIAYEDQTEWNPADYNYHDMIFSIYIAPTIEQTVEDKLNIAASSKQWWERDEREGLSGRLSHPAVSVNLQGDSGGLSDKELRRSHFEKFNHTEIDADNDENNIAHNIWTMHANGSDDVIEFPRAAFVYDGKYNTGVLDRKNEIVAQFLALADVGKEKAFYYTKGDLVDYIQQFVKDDKAAEVEKWYDVEANDWNYQLAVEEITRDRNSNMYTFLPIDSRWEDKDEDQKTRTERATLKEQDNGDDLGAMVVSRDPVIIRKLAADIVGSSVESVPVVRTEGFAELTDAVVEKGSLAFIAGEIKHDTTKDMLVEGIKSDGVGIPIRPDLLTFPEVIDASGTYRTDYAKAFFADPPLDMKSRSALDTAAKKAVDMCYVDYFDGDDATKQKVQNAYGVKEERFSIGFHRSGKDFELQAENSQDRMEIVALGVRGFNPFQTTKYPVYIANEKFGDPDDPSYGIYSNYDDNGGVAPTFVFDKLIDGAGALVINGNLHIKSTFAYYGVLVVLGDLIIEPTKHENEFVYNSEGNPVDEYGYTIYRDSPNSNTWHYKKGEAPLDENGIPRDNPTPARQTVYRGELIVQGTVAVKGRVITKQTATVDDEGNPGPTYTGILHAFWNRTAVTDAGTAFSNGSPAVRRISWSHNDNINVDNIWQDKADAVTP